MSARSHGSAAAGRGGAQAAATVRDFARKLAHRSARKRPALARIVSGIPTAPARPALAPPSEDATGARRCRGQAPPRCPRIAAMYLRCRQTLRAQIVNADAVATRIEPADPETAAGRGTAGPNPRHDHVDRPLGVVPDLLGGGAPVDLGI